MDAAFTTLQLAALILIKLPLAYDMVSRALRCEVPNSQLDFDDLFSKLLKEESILLSQSKLTPTTTGCTLITRA